MLFGKKIPWLSLILLLLTYGFLGWLYGEKMIELTGFLRQEWLLEYYLAAILSHLSGVVLICLVTLALIGPFTILTTGLEQGFESKFSAIMAIVLSALAFVLILRWLTFFVRLLVLVAAVLVFRIDMHMCGYNKKQSKIGAILGCSFGFILGIIARYYWDIQ
ncbi:MAG: hypothetical protein D6756_13430 [Cyanobacteria bacterium J083]|nr:MAG: hypothetical protein D6756_13430 [Cyanobacteria bacterium J083]